MQSLEVTDAEPSGLRSHSGAVSIADSSRDTHYRDLALIAAVAVAGLMGFSSELTVLWRAWIDDPLRSCGILIPPAAIYLSFRAWCGVRLSGNWIGLILI